MKIVTTGMRYVDIDAYAGCVAYAELLQTQGQEAIAVGTAPLNESVSRTVRSWPTLWRTDYKPTATDTFVLIDVSEPDHFDKIVDLTKVDEVIDHHLGYEDYWQKRIGSKAHIEFIGAACTLVYEQWISAGLFEKMSATSARLLICGILDNTLNFGADVSTQRDVDAYNALLTRANLPDGWTTQYFTECQEAILSDAVAAIQNDSKTLMFKTYGKDLLVGQLVVWDGQQVLAKYQGPLRTALAKSGSEWFINLVSISGKRSYFISDSDTIRSWLTKLLGARFDGSVAAADRQWLRKEIVKQDINSSQTL